jgi:hypothetical protein
VQFKAYAPQKTQHFSTFEKFFCKWNAYVLRRLATRFRQKTQAQRWFSGTKHHAMRSGRCIAAQHGPLRCIQNAAGAIHYR